MRYACVCAVLSAGCAGKLSGHWTPESSAGLNDAELCQAIEEYYRVAQWGRGGGWLLKEARQRGLEQCIPPEEKILPVTASASPESGTEHAFAVVQSVQVINQTTLGTAGAGGSVGYGLGAATYFDTTRVQNWSATAGIASGLLGALIGSAMIDQPPTVRYQHIYAVRFINGDVKQLDQTSDSPAPSYPVGACLRIRDRNSIVEQVSNASCEPPAAKATRRGAKKAAN